MAFAKVGAWFNDAGVGYYLIRRTDESLLRSVVPMLELHLNTPLNHRGLDAGLINFSDALDLTGGVHILLPHSKLGFAVCTPLTGPKPYDVEVAASLEYRW